MATVTGITAERMAELVAAYIVDATVSDMGNLILTTAGGTEIDAGPIILNGTASQYYRGDKTWQTLNKSAVGLSNVDNVSVVADYIPKWKPNTAYLADDLVLSPFGQLLKAKSVLLTPAAFSTTGWLDLTPSQERVRKNLATNPAMKGTNASAVIRTNLVVNPSSNGASTTGWTPARTTISATNSVITGLAQKYFRVTLSDITAGSYVQRVDLTPIPITAGLTYAISLWLRTVGGPRQAGAQLYFLDASSVQVGASVPVGTVGTASWTKISTTAVAPVGATQALIRVGTPNQTSWAVSETFDFGAVLFEANGIVDTYIDGAVAASGDFTYAWSGTAYNSTSQQKALPVTNITANIGGGTGAANYSHQTATDVPPGMSNAAKAVWTQASSGGSPGMYSVSTVSGVVGDTITAKLWVKYNVARNIKFLVRPRLGSVNQAPDTTIVTPVPANTWTELVYTTVATGNYDNILVWPLAVTPGSSFAAGDYMLMGKILIEKSAYIGDYFDGDTVDADGVDYGWSGTAHTTMSTATPAVSISKWRPGTQYSAGEQIISPWEELVEAKTTHISGSTWTSAESGNWHGYDQVMTFANNGFVWSAGQNWDAGALALDITGAASSQSSGATFATAGSVSGSIKFLEPGLYDVVWDCAPASDVGNAGYRIVAIGTWPGPIDFNNGIFGQGVHMSGQSFWETKITATGIRVPQANLEIRFTGAQTNGSTNIPRIKIIKRASV